MSTWMLMLTYTRLMLTYSLSPFERGFPFAWETYKCGRLEILKVLTQALRPLPLYKGTLGHRRCCLGLNFPRDDPHNHGSVLSPYLSSDPLPLSSSCSILSCSCPCLNFPAGCLLRRKKKKKRHRKCIYSQWWDIWLTPWKWPYPVWVLSTFIC
jgi:hypothetical protein